MAPTKVNMTRADLWKIFTDKNPKMSGDDESHITMTVRGLRKLFETAYDQGHDQGFENGKAWEAAHPKETKSDIFNDMFGKGNPFSK
jgi:hypothetical protein